MIKIAPIFRNLNELVIYLRKWSRWRPKVDLIELCPNLTALESDILPFEWRSKPFPSLKSFIYCNAEIHIDHEFLKHNSQLKRLRLYGEEIRNGTVEAISKYLPDIEDLFVKVYGNFRCIQPLSRLSRLTNLFLSGVYNEHLVYVFRCLTETISLREFKLVIHAPEVHRFESRKQRQEAQNALISMAKVLKNLELMLAIGLGIDSKTIIEFIQEARQLKTICLIEMNVNDAVIERIAEVISNRKEIDKLNIFVDEDTFDSLSITNNENISRSLTIRRDEELVTQKSIRLCFTRPILEIFVTKILFNLQGNSCIPNAI